MNICTVVGHVWATKKDEALNGLKFMVVRKDGAESGDVLVAADMVGAGIGERVLVVSGSTARVAASDGSVPVDAAIVGIVDSMETDEKRETWIETA